jgi:hypothetical protein
VPLGVSRRLFLGRRRACPGDPDESSTVLT